MNVLEVRVMVQAQDFERSARFYRNTLGLDEVLETWDGPVTRGMIARLCPGAVIEIVEMGDRPVSDYAERGVIGLALRLDRTEDVDAWHERLTAAGAAVSGPPSNHPWGERSFAVYDPDGNPVTLFARLTQTV